MKSAISELEQASHALSRTLYEGAGQQAAGGDGAGAKPGPAAGSPPEDEAIDAEFEVKDS
jgi:molecular chaperone DnaK